MALREQLPCPVQAHTGPRMVHAWHWASLGAALPWRSLGCQGRPKLPLNLMDSSRRKKAKTGKEGATLGEGWGWTQVGACSASWVLSSAFCLPSLQM